jgi:class 3 adenylate cyclase
MKEEKGNFKLLLSILTPFFFWYCTDIVGFTSWSSDRPPADVSTLLETIYGQFDKIAKKRSVFKVETIGDCYVAVTGVPERRFDHAINMTKFARDMLVILQEELKNLEPILGSDTLNLAMRVGLHSGPVTAGVLRGERARFQLFGDSVNTASRMESSSSRNAIHVSEATATLLQSAGKQSWLIKREEKIVAKGKGEVQTYWVRTLPSRGEASVVHSLATEATETSGREEDDRASTAGI